jgi:truncated hemoglobin YjbI
MSKETQNSELSTDKALHIADVMHRFYQKIAKDHKVHTDRILLAITDNGKYFQAYVTNEEETDLKYLQDYTIPNGA